MDPKRSKKYIVHPQQGQYTVFTCIHTSLKLSKQSCTQEEGAQKCKDIWRSSENFLEFRGPQPAFLQWISTAWSHRSAHWPGSTGKLNIINSQWIHHDIAMMKHDQIASKSNCVRFCKHMSWISLTHTVSIKWKVLSTQIPVTSSDTPYLKIDSYIKWPGKPGSPTFSPSVDLGALEASALSLAWFGCAG